MIAKGRVFILALSIGIRALSREFLPTLAAYPLYKPFGTAPLKEKRQMHISIKQKLPTFLGPEASILRPCSFSPLATTWVALLFPVELKANGLTEKWMLNRPSGPSASIF